MSNVSYFVLQLLDDFTEEDDEALLDIYQASGAALTYQKQAARQPVAEYTIICDMAVTVEKVKKGVKPIIKINKQQANKANRYMNDVGK